MYQTAYNTTDQPVVIDDEGRTIAGLEWGSIDADNVPALEAVMSGRLLVIDVPPTADADARFSAAWLLTKELSGSDKKKTDKKEAN